MSEKVVTGPVGVPPIVTAKMTRIWPKPEGSCMWFLKCENQATTTQAHATLGDVPVCDSCHEFANS